MRMYEIAPIWNHLRFFGKQIISKLNEKIRVIIFEIMHVAKIQSKFSFGRRPLLHFSITRTKDLIVTKQVGLESQPGCSP